MLWLMELMRDSVLISVSGWYVVSTLLPVVVSMLPLVVVHWLVVDVVAVDIVRELVVTSLLSTVAV